MLEILNNTWFAGIMTGILSGLLVTYITNKIFSKRDEKELARNIDAANRELIFTLRSEISEDSIPELSVVESLINATARKYKLEARNLFKPKQISEELIKEIMDSSFISSTTKKSFCNSLKKLVPDRETNLDIQIQKENEMFVNNVEYKEKMTMIFSIILGFITAITGIYTVIRPDPASSSIVAKAFDSVFPILIAVSAVLITVEGAITAMKLRHKKLRQDAGIVDVDTTKSK